MKIINKKFGLILFILSLSLSSIAQTVVIPDTNFRKFLKVNYRVLNSNDELIIDSAKSFSFEMIIPNLDIRSLEGVQYFKKITKLDIYGNFLVKIPRLDSLKNLVQILGFNNQLDSFPDISKLVNIQLINLGNNSLTAFPSVGNSAKLSVLNLTRNKLQSVPSLNSLSGLQNLNVGDNFNLKSLPSLNSNLNLEDLLIYKCDFSSFPDISFNRKLKHIYAGYNKYATLPDFSGYPNLSFVEITYCNLTFEDFVPLTVIPGFDTLFKISPQNYVGQEYSISQEAYSKLTIDLGIDKGLTTNVYKWFKNGTLVATINNSFLRIDTLKFTDQGDYTCEITNTSPKLSGKLTLFSNPIHVKVTNPCLNARNMQYQKKDISCNGTGEITIDTLSISAGVKPYSYKVTNTITGLTITSSDGHFYGLQDGKYKLVLKDKVGCVKEISGIEIFRKTERVADDCKGIAITPDGDGVNDTYYISEQGTATIFNSKGQVVKTLSTPANWDGTDNSGQVAGDFYLIKVRDHLINITVIH